jgi:hypothetical protein
MPFSKRELVLLVLIVVTGACLRLYRLDQIPPGLAGDTAYKGIAANRILGGQYPVFFEESWGGIEPMYMYLLAGLFRFLGSTSFAIKLLSAIIGIMTIPLLYVLIRELLHSPAIGLLASAFLAISFWHISYSRLGWEIILGPPFVILTLYLMWRALQTSWWRAFAWAGLALGASLYTYQAQRFLPLLIVCYLGYRSLLERGFWREYGPKAVLLLAIAILVFSPLGWYFVTHSDAFFGRAAEVSIFNPEKNPRGPLYSLAASTLKVLGTYNVRGDPLWRHNLPGRPAFGVLTSIFFLVGLAFSVTQWRQRSYSLLLFWLVVLTLPPILTAPRDVPHFSRSIGALPAACTFPAIGLVLSWQWLSSRWHSVGSKIVAAFCLAIVLAVGATLSVRDYFFVWASNPNLRDHYFDGQFVDLAAVMNELAQRDGVWILPLNALSSPHDEPGHHTVEFLYRGEAPFHFLRLDEALVAEELTRVTSGRDRVMLVEYKNYVLEEAYNYIDADPKRLLPFLLSKYSHESQRHEFEAFDVRVYPLPTSTPFTIAESFQSVDGEFGGQLQLTGVALGPAGRGNGQLPQVPSGEEAWVALQWTSLTKPVANYKAALFLLDQRNRILGQVDKPLLSNHMRLTSEWRPGQKERDYYLVPILPATAPGNYDLEIVVYDPNTMERLAVQSGEGGVSGDSFAAAKLQIERSVLPPVVKPTCEVSDGYLTSDLFLLGYDGLPDAVNPGDLIEVALYWEALQDVGEDYLVELQLEDASGANWARDRSQPAYGDFPTSLWKRGEVVRDWHELRVPAHAPGGSYQLHLTLQSNSGSVAELMLGAIVVSGRARSYDIPPMEEELGWRVGDGIELLGYDLDPRVQAGDPLAMTLYWRCLSEMSQSYTVFTHVLDSNDVIRGQVDRVPGVAAVPTTSWIPGEVVTDRYEIPLDPEAPAGEYKVEIGMYDPATMERLSVFDPRGEQQGDSILLATVMVEG